MQADISSALPLIQLIAYVGLTVANLAVAIASARIAYRNNFGWKPMVFVTSYGFRGVGGSNDFDATVFFEVWNRQKYPIVIRSLWVRFHDLQIDAQRADDREGWRRYQGGLLNDTQCVLDATAHQKFSALWPFSGSLDAVDSRLDVTVWYFDPRRNRHREVKARRRFTLNKRPRLARMLWAKFRGSFL